MLVLSRKLGEQIVLPETRVSISVLGVHGNRVQIGIEAPRAVSVYREEVWRLIADLIEPTDPAGEPVGEEMNVCRAM